MTRSCKRTIHTKWPVHLKGQCHAISVKLQNTKLEIVLTRAAPAFDNLFMGCVFIINTVHKTVEKFTFQALY